MTRHGTRENGGGGSTPNDRVLANSLGWISWRIRRNREEAHDEHPVVGPAGPRRAHVRRVGRHEGLHVRQDQRGGPVLWRVAAESLDGPWHLRTRLHGRADHPCRLPL